MKVAVGQFAATATTVVSLTSDRQIIELLLWSTRPEHFSGTSTVGGIKYCVDQLATAKGRRSVIVLIGSGKNNVESKPEPIAQMFQENGGLVLSVGVGLKPDMMSLRRISGADWKTMRVLPEQKEWETGRAITNKMCWG